MKKTKIVALIAGTALAGLTAACTETATTPNANMANSNTAVVVNNNANMAVVGNTNMSNAERRARNYNMSRADYDRDDKNYRTEVKGAGDTVGSGLEDGWIHFKTKGALALVDDLRDSTINVDVDNNVVTLRGTVANAAHRAAAEKTARGIDGVKTVKNSLKLAAEGDKDDDEMPANRNMNANANIRRP